MQYHVRYCLNCEADQEMDGPPTCTECVSPRITTSSYDPGPITLNDGGGATREYGTARLWQEQWYRTILRFRRLRAAYRPGGYQDDRTEHDAVGDFFDHCLRVGDWLWGDKVATQL